MNQSSERLADAKMNVTGPNFEWSMENEIVKHKIEQIRSLKEMLAQLPTIEVEATEVSTLEAVKLLRPEVISLQRKGYSFEMIAKILDEHGFAVTASTLKKYRSARKPDSQRKGAKKDLPAPEHLAPAAQGSLFCATDESLSRHGKNVPATQKTGGFTPLEDTRDI
jgi:hypothetical protein